VIAVAPASLALAGSVQVTRRGDVDTLECEWRSPWEAYGMIMDGAGTMELKSVRARIGVMWGHTMSVMRIASFATWSDVMGFVKTRRFAMNVPFGVLWTLDIFIFAAINAEATRRVRIMERGVVAGGNSCGATAIECVVVCFFFFGRGVQCMESWRMSRAMYDMMARVLVVRETPGSGGMQSSLCDDEIALDCVDCHDMSVSTGTNPIVFRMSGVFDSSVMMIS